MTSVCPALCPPWKRAITSARSESQSTILPLPSSPHCAPTTTTLPMSGAPSPLPPAGLYRPEAPPAREKGSGRRAGWAGGSVTAAARGRDHSATAAASRNRVVSSAAAISVRVYSSSGWSKIASVGPCSTIRPLFITMM